MLQCTVFIILFAILACAPVFSATDDYWEEPEQGSNCLVGALRKIQNLTHWWHSDREDDAPGEIFEDSSSESEGEEDQSTAQQPFLIANDSAPTFVKKVDTHYRRAILGFPMSEDQLGCMDELIADGIAYHIMSLPIMLQGTLANCYNSAIKSAAAHTYQQLRSSRDAKTLSFAQCYFENLLCFIRDAQIPHEQQTLLFCSAAALLVDTAKIKERSWEFSIDYNLFFPNALCSYHHPTCKEKVSLNLSSVGALLKRYADILAHLRCFLPKNTFACVAIRYMLLTEPEAISKIPSMQSILHQGFFVAPENMRIDDLLLFSSDPQSIKRTQEATTDLIAQMRLLQYFYNKLRKTR